MKYNRAQVCGSKSSINVVTNTYGAHHAGNLKQTTEFVNHGLLHWDEGRKKWIGHGKARHRSRFFRLKKLRNWHAACVCCGNQPDKSCLQIGIPFPKPIPLSGMVEFLVDIWETEEM